MIDGGKGQLSAVVEALRQMNLQEDLRGGAPGQAAGGGVPAGRVQAAGPPAPTSPGLQLLPSPAG
jgi:hypothetical protein